MIRTNTVKLTSIPAVAYRQKTNAGDSTIVIVKPDVPQPGIASVSKKTGEPVLLANVNAKEYPLEAFKEAMNLTYGMPYKKQGSVKVTKDMFVEPVAEEEEEEVVINEAAYQKVLDHYTDKNGKISYDLINKEMIKFAKSSSIVREMVADGKKANEICDYISFNKLRNVSGNLDMPDAEVAKIIELLDEVSPKGVFKDLNTEIRNMLSKKKK